MRLGDSACKALAKSWRPRFSPQNPHNTLGVGCNLTVSVMKMQKQEALIDEFCASETFFVKGGGDI